MILFNTIQSVEEYIVSDSTRAIIILVLVILVLLAFTFLGSNLLARRAIKTVIKMFRERQALSPETAMTAEALGFQRRSILQVRAFRDYKPAALQFLMRNNIVQATEDGRLYLSEAILAQTNIAQQVK
jgi:hypothetical protein